ncbi:MAG TPA: hypothetical protein VFA68_06955 [Terriglobales bacterium]|nr:hypothetical protein [Terriglobales bacterium]
MDAALKQLRIMQFAMLGAVVLYVVIGEVVPHTVHPVNPIVFQALALAAAGTVFVLFFLRRMTLRRTQPAQGAPTLDNSAVARWRTGMILTLVLSEAIALYGLVLRMIGFSLSEAAPFYVAGFTLMLFLGPRKPSNEIG